METNKVVYDELENFLKNPVINIFWDPMAQISVPMMTANSRTKNDLLND